MTAPIASGNDPITVSPRGEQLERFLDSLDVEHHWLSHNRVTWETGEVIGPSNDPAHSTHCSAFVAAACQRLNIPMLHPPEHPQKLLANAQFNWLETQGPRQGWRPVDGAAEAQGLANRGHFVVGVYKNPDPKRSGHIVIVRPVAKTDTQLAEEGPDVIQAGGHNFNRTNARRGFAAHPLAFERGEIAYFAHRVDGLESEPTSAPAAPASR